MLYNIILLGIIIIGFKLGKYVLGDLLKLGLYVLLGIGVLILAGTILSGIIAGFASIVIFIFNIIFNIVKVVAIIAIVFLIIKFLVKVIINAII